ncbi:MAG: GNAT family N-acetyltransferase [bacterium]|nr:GNAT family N-acetyltransferase [bacterium]
MADISDASAIARLSGQLGYPASARQSEKRLSVILGSNQHAVFVACAGDEVIGWVHVFLAIRVESDSFAELGGFVVAKKHRRCGIGRRLLAAAEDWAVTHSVARLRVRSRSNRLDVRAFYENLGFSITKEQRVFDKPLETRTIQTSAR